MIIIINLRIISHVTASSVEVFEEYEVVVVVSSLQE